MGLQKIVVAFCLILMILVGTSVIFSSPKMGEANSANLDGEIEISDPSAASLFEQGNVVAEIPTSKKYIALTFDDGPDQRTEEILDVLKKTSVRATFFVVGENCRLRPQILKRIHDEGHEIGNHTFSHMTFRGKSEQQITQEILETNQIIQEVIGETPYLFRPSGGTLNQKILRVSNALNMRIILWSNDEDSKDWRSPGVGVIIKNVVSHAKEGKIVLLHDGGGNRSQTLRALPQIISELKKEGLEMVTVTELLRARTVVETQKSKDGY